MKVQYWWVGVTFSVHHQPKQQFTWYKWLTLRSPFKLHCLTSVQTDRSSLHQCRKSSKGWPECLDIRHRKVVQKKIFKFYKTKSMKLRNKYIVLKFCKKNSWSNHKKMVSFIFETYHGVAANSSHIFADWVMTRASNFPVLAANDSNVLVSSHEDQRS